MVRSAVLCGTPEGAANYSEIAARYLDANGHGRHGYEARLELWYRRVWELQGLWIDPETHATVSPAEGAAPRRESVGLGGDRGTEQTHGRDPE